MRQFALIAFMLYVNSFSIWSKEAKKVSIFSTIRCCSARGGRGIKAFLIISPEIDEKVEPVEFLLK